MTKINSKILCNFKIHFRHTCNENSALYCPDPDLFIRKLFNLAAQTMSATEIVRKADEKFNGEKSRIMVMSMTIIRPTWQRTVEFKNWTHGTRLFSHPDYCTCKRCRVRPFLKEDTEMWNWNPSINRLIKLPPSMMSQGWMGSDYTNDDILKESSVVNDYTHEIMAEETD